MSHTEELWKDIQRMNEMARRECDDAGVCSVCGEEYRECDCCDCANGPTKHVGSVWCVRHDPMEDEYDPTPADYYDDPREAE